MANSDQKTNNFSLERELELGEEMSLQEDIPFIEDTEINDNTASQSFYDCIMEGFILRFFKIKEQETGIGLRAKALSTWMMLFQRIATILTRYESRNMYTSFRFEISKMLFMTIGRNSAKYRGDKYIDVREHFQSDDGKNLIPTKIGIRIPTDYIQPLEDIIRSLVENFTALATRAIEIVNTVKFFLVEKDIRTTRMLEKNCFGCRANHSCQKRHEMEGGCLDTNPWSDIVDESLRTRRKIIPEKKAAANAGKKALAPTTSNAGNKSSQTPTTCNACKKSSQTPTTSNVSKKSSQTPTMSNTGKKPSQTPTKSNNDKKFSQVSTTSTITVETDESE